MSEQSHDALRQLAAPFQIEALGEGDPNLGINLLATMAGVLADLAPTDGTIRIKGGRPARLGVNLLVTGPASAGLVGDEVLTEVGLRQANLWHYLLRYSELIEQQRQKPGASLPPMDPKSGAPEDRVAGTQHELDPLFHSRAEGWGRIFSEAPEEDVIALVNRPKFLVSLSKPEELPSQLRGLRPGSTLVHAGCTRPKDLAAMAESGSALIEGRYSLGNGCETARGHFLLTDPLQMLHKAAKDPDDDTAWLGHFLWICDGNAGPCAPTIGNATDEPETITTRFRMALDTVLAQRMNLPEKEPIQLALDTRQAKVRFRKFLADMEPRLPGISLAAKNLIDSLTFGLGELAKIARPSHGREPVEGLETPLPLSIAGVEALARFLVARMANARAVILDAAAVALRRSQIERVYWKLQQGPVDVRKICRDLKLKVCTCEPCLRWLEEAGLARRVNRTWAIMDGARLRFDDHTTPLLEV